jgi:hypothetical protein
MDFFEAWPMAARRVADAVVVIHLLFIVWVMAGGFAVWWRPRLAWLHLPAVAWGVWIEWSGGICPLTPLENRLRRAAGEGGYDGGFVEHYVVPLIYPAALDRPTQWLLGGAVLLVNLLVYARLWRGRRGSSR